MTVTSRYPLEDTPPMDLFEPSDSEQAISTATAAAALPSVCCSNSSANRAGSCFVHVDVLPWEGSKIPMHPCRRIDLGALQDLQS